jgi:hypothetical protein
MKKMIAAAAAAALLAASSAPADAHRWHHYRHHHGIGGFLAGALVVGTIASISSGGSEKRRNKQDYAVRSCSDEAETRTGGHVAEVGRVSKRHGYFTVEGLVENGRDAPRQGFACTVRGGAIYSFRATVLAA